MQELPVPTPGQSATKVLLVSTSFPTSLDDWKGLFIRHMADSLGRRADVALRLWAPPGEVDERVVLDPPPDDRKWLTKLMERGGIAHVFRHQGFAGKLKLASLMIRLRRTYKRNSDVDLFHINWLQNALPVPASSKPMLVTALGSDIEFLSFPLVRIALRKQFAGRRVVICPNADWMVEPLVKAFGDLAEIRFVSFGIDPTWFTLRRVPISPARWIAVTRLTKAKLGPLFEWTAPLFSEGRRELHLFGPMQEDIAIPPWVRFHGPVTPAELQSTWFPTSSGLFTLSRHAEGRPQVMLEAMAAGLPVLASDIAPHSSFVKHGDTGWLCDSAASLACGLNSIEHTATGMGIGQAGRAWALREVGSWDDCAARYVRIYEELLASEIL